MSYNEWHKECGQNTYNWHGFIFILIIPIVFNEITFR